MKSMLSETWQIIFTNSVTETIIFALVEADLLRNAWLAVAIGHIYNIIMKLIN